MRSNCMMPWEYEIAAIEYRGDVGLDSEISRINFEVISEVVIVLAPAVATLLAVFLAPFIRMHNQINNNCLFCPNPYFNHNFHLYFGIFILFRTIGIPLLDLTIKISGLGFKMVWYMKNFSIFWDLIFWKESFDEIAAWISNSYFY